MPASAARRAIGTALLLVACQAGESEPGSSGSAGAAGASAGNTASAGAAMSGGGGLGASGAGWSGGGGSGGSSAGAGGSGPLGGSGGASGAGGSPVSADYCADRPGLLFCDDFEAATNDTLASAPWSISLIASEGSVSVDATSAHSGERSVLVDGNGFDTLLVYHDTGVLPVNRLYVRSFVRIVAPLNGGHNSFLIADTIAAPNQGNNFRFGEMYEMLMHTVAGDSNAALSNQNFWTDMLPGKKLTVDGWSCLEVLLDRAAPELRVWVDDQEVPDLHANFPLDAYDALRFGFEQYAGPARQLWFDDIALGSERIFCN